MCTPIIDGHAVYFLLLPGPGGIVHKLLSGISPFLSLVCISFAQDGIKRHRQLTCIQRKEQEVDEPLFKFKFDKLCLTVWPLVQQRENSLLKKLTNLLTGREVKCQAMT